MPLTNNTIDLKHMSLYRDAIPSGEVIVSDRRRSRCMSDWVDTVADVIFQVADMAAHPRNTKQLVATVCAAFASFFAITTIVSWVLGFPLPVGGLALILPTILFLLAIAGYCVLTDRGNGEGAS
jgi:hypothetical protein